MRVLLVAEEAAGVQVMRKLLASPHELVAVLTASNGAERGATVASVAKGAGVPLLPARLVKDASFADWMRDQRVDLLLNVHSLYLVDGAVVEAAQIGSFNLHPGPLPGYAGLNAPSWALYNGEMHHAVTVHWMDRGIDTGGVAFMERFPVEDGDTGLSVALRCVRLGVPLVERLLETAAEQPNAIPRLSQEGERRYFGREAPEGGKLSWDRRASEVVAFIRAADYTPFASPWGHPRTMQEGRSLGIVKAARTGEPSTAPPGTVGVPQDRSIRVAAADEWVLVNRVHADGRIEPAIDVLKPGARLSVPPES